MTDESTQTSDAATWANSQAAAQQTYDITEVGLEQTQWTDDTTAQGTWLTDTTTAEDSGLTAIAAADQALNVNTYATSEQTYANTVVGDGWTAGRRACSKIRSPS